MTKAPNQIYEAGYYNEYQKERYIKTLAKKSAEQYKRVLSRAKVLEERYDIDLYNFNLYQIESLLNYLAPSTLSSSRANFYAVQNYIRWGIEENLREDNLNPLELLSDATYLKKFIDDTKKMLYTKEEIDRMVASCNNAQDAFPVIAIFEGLYGESGYEELLNLTKHDVLDDNTLRLKDGEQVRQIRVSDECIKIALKALNETTYLKKNGESLSTLKAPNEASLVANDYVLKNVDTRTKDDGRGEKHMILRRITAVKGYNDDWVKNLTPSIVRNSGMLYMAKTLCEDYGTLGREQVDQICLQFNIRKIKNGKTFTFNSYRIVNDFLNIGTINKVYGTSYHS